MTSDTPALQLGHSRHGAFDVAMRALVNRWTGLATPEEVVGYIFDALDESGDTAIPRTNEARDEAVVMVGMVFTDIGPDNIDYGAVVSHALRAAERVGSHA